jgi:low molecular weight phosphotyrosine protein phosphatase
MGEAVLRHIAKERNIDLTVDSAGTAGYHIDEEPDRRSVYLSRVFARH